MLNVNEPAKWRRTRATSARRAARTSNKRHGSESHVYVISKAEIRDALKCVYVAARINRYSLLA